MDDDPFDPDRNLPSLRASDGEREVTAQILQSAFSEGRLTLAEFDERTAQAYGARFQVELADLTRDLAPTARHLPQSQPEVAPSHRVTGESGIATSIAILGGVDRKGVWTVAPVHTAIAVMGGGSLDLRHVTLTAHETTIRAFAFWGGLEILVPDDIHLDVDGFGVMGGFSEERGSRKQDSNPVPQAPPGAPRVRVTGLAVWAGVGVRRVPRDPEHP